MTRRVLKLARTLVRGEQQEHPHSHNVHMKVSGSLKHRSWRFFRRDDGGVSFWT
jgi:hypothetical protein